VEINNIRPTTSQHFLPLDKDGNVIFQSWLPRKTALQVQCLNVPDGKLVVSYYRRNYPPASPPFSTTESNDDIFPANRVFNLNVSDGKTEILNPEEEGIYLFRSDSAANEGFTMNQFDDEYPDMTRAEQMIFPLRYLCSNSEFEKITQSRNPEWAINDFWFAAGGIDERATELKNEYFGRVKVANQYFTSYKEGWKTDRGMIYVIFGKPTTIYRRTGLETWIYSQQGERVSINFDFYNYEHPFTNADYKLKRLPDYKIPWFFAVDYWRR
jgi:GWxTD domain-containing protein